MTTYNYKLYEIRKGLGYSRIKMARCYKISTFYYRLIENGYLKPNKRTVGFISEFIGEDFSVYVNGPASNPADLPERENKLIGKIYYLLGKLWFRIACISLTVLSLGFTISGFVIDATKMSDYTPYYETSYVDFANEVRENGKTHFTILDSITVPEIDQTYPDPDTGETKYIEIIGHYEDSKYLNLRFRSVYRTQEARIIANVSDSTIGDSLGDITFEVTFYDPDLPRRTFYFEIGFDGVNRPIVDYSEFKGTSVYDIVFKKQESIFTDYETLINDNMTTKLTLNEILKIRRNANDRMAGYLAYSAISTLLGFIMTAVLAFATIFSFLYGRQKGVVGMRFSPDKPYEIEDLPDRKPLKKDIRFAPFIPETVLELFGIGLLFLAIITRFGGYIDGFFGVTSLGNYLNSSEITNAMGMFILGLFLLYFIDFDIFLEDRRAVRNIFLYAIVFFCLYYIEASILSSIRDNSVVGNLTQLIQVPNMFSSISCYFAITFFLFYTPKKANTRTKIIIFRCLSILPIAWIIVSWVIFRGYGVFYEAEWSVWLLYLFNGERLPFSILAICYLVGLFFLRLFYERRYGKNNAQIYFNSNKFLWQKNLLTAVIIAVVALVEWGLRNNQTAVKMDIGAYWQLWILAPIILFYHPHKGPRNKAVDYTTLVLYVLALAVAYVAIALMALFSFAESV